MFSTISLALLVGFIALVILWRKKTFSHFKELGIPGPEPSLLFGNMWELCKKGNIHCHKEWTEKYGKVFGYYSGMTPVLCVSDLDLIKKVMISDFHNFMNRPNLFGSKEELGILGNTITVIGGKRWKEIRSIITPAFTTSKMKAMFPTITECIDETVQVIDEKAKSKKSFNIYPIYQHLTMDFITRTVFGIKTEVQRNPADPLVRVVRLLITVEPLFALLLQAFPPILRFPEKIFLYLINRGKDPFEEVLDNVTDVITARRNDKSARRNDLLQSMIDSHIPEGDLQNMKQFEAGDEVDKIDNTINKQSGKLNRYLTDNEIKANSFSLLLAGYETTSTALGFTTHLLVTHPDIQDKLRAEITEVAKECNEINYNSVQKMKYLDQVFNESLRMYPPVTMFVAREALEDTSYGNIVIKKGMGIQIPVYLLHHDPELWPNPETFNPDRFSAENKTSVNPITWQSFGAGPRNCVGMRLAQIEAKTTLAKILFKYKLVQCEKTERNLELRISQFLINPKNGVFLKAVPV